MFRTIPKDLLPREMPLKSITVNQPQTIDFLPYAFPPISSVPFDVVDSTNILAGSTLIINIINTGTNKAVIRWFGNETIFIGDYAGLRWSILFDGVAKSPYSQMQESRGAISNPDPVLIPVNLNTLVQVSVFNGNAVAALAKTRIKGWLY